MPDIQRTFFTLEHPDEPGRVIRGRIEGPASVRTPYVLIVHGFKGFMNWGFFPELSARIASAGMVAIAFNTSGSGIGADLEDFTEEEGFAKNTFSRELEDIERVRTEADAGGLPGVGPGPCAILGHSRGGGTALLHAAARGDYRSIVTWAAIDHVDRVDEPMRAEWRERGFLLVHNARTGQDHRIDLEVLEDMERNRERLDIRAACGRISAPVLLVHGTADESVEHASAGRLAAALPAGAARLLSIDGTGHTFGARHPFAGVTASLETALGASIEHLGRHFD